MSIEKNGQHFNIFIISSTLKKKFILFSSLFLPKGKKTFLIRIFIWEKYTFLYLKHLFHGFGAKWTIVYCSLIHFFHFVPKINFGRLLFSPNIVWFIEIEIYETIFEKWNYISYFILKFLVLLQFHVSFTILNIFINWIFWKEF